MSFEINQGSQPEKKGNKEENLIYTSIAQKNQTKLSCTAFDYDDASHISHLDIKRPVNNPTPDLN